MGALEIERKVERAAASDIPALAQLRSAQGWQPSPRMLRAVQAWDGGRIFLLRESALASPSNASLVTGSADLPIATASAIAAPPVGVIGNVIVRADYRRRGLGRVVMEASLGWLRSRGVRHVLLAATPDGRPLYARLGFVALEPSWFVKGVISALDAAAVRAQSGGLRAEVAPAEALRECAAIDATAFGGDRLGLLELLLREPATWLYMVRDTQSGTQGGEATDGAPTGYLILRRQHAQRDTVQIGPWVATSPAAAAALLAAVLDDAAPWHPSIAPGDEPRLLVCVDRREALESLVAARATLVEDDVVMQLDFAAGDAREGAKNLTAAGSIPQPVAAHPEWLYAWLAPMVF